MSPPSAVALVHHANQHLITEGYDNREGLGDCLDGYSAVLRLHARYNIVANLHLSGTLLEAAAWHRPAFAHEVRALIEQGIVSLVGGAYADHVMTLLGSDLNTRAVTEQLAAYERLLGADPTTVGGFWVPERVWDTSRLADVIADPALPNGGFRWVVLDDRLLFAGPDRAAFDATGPYAGVTHGDADPRRDPDAVWRTHRIAGGSGLAMVPMSARLRYAVPPAGADDWATLERTLQALRQQSGPALAVYADDMEKTAGVGPWRPALDSYEALLRWLADRRGDVPAVRLDDWVAEVEPAGERRIEAGTFYELAHEYGAGEDYRGWSDDPRWADCRRWLETAAATVRAAVDASGDGRLLDLATKHLLASAHETGWQDGGSGSFAPSPWARTVASHARSCLPIVTAATAFGDPGLGAGAVVAVGDVDDDGDAEVTLRNGDLSVVCTPRWGGRVVALFERLAAGGVSSIGNPTDHWNWQEELNRSMDVPRNHPGALADVGHEHDVWTVSSTRASDGFAYAELVDSQHGSPLWGARKRLLLSGRSLAVCYQLPPAAPRLSVDSCLSPDYLSLLRDGGRALAPVGGPGWRGWRNGDAAVWVAVDDGEDCDFAQPARAEVGHGLLVRVSGSQPHFHLLLGCGETDARQCGEQLRTSRESLHELARGPRRDAENQTGGAP